MNRTILLISVLIISACSSQDSGVIRKNLSVEFVKDRIHLDWNYNYSSHVVHAVLVSSEKSRSNSGSCSVRYSNFKVIESFKGGLKAGEIFKASGISIHEYTVPETEQLVFLKPFIATNYPGYGECINSDYVSYLSIHNWCCSIDKDSPASLVMYDMINSEQATENYLVPVDGTFEYLRKLNK